jgi:hypothetical protein
MMDAVGLEVEATVRDHPEIMRSLIAACALCESVDPCVWALEAGSARATASAFCLNSPLLEALSDYEETVRDIAARSPV